jgi:hypothetical protein
MKIKYMDLITFLLLFAFPCLIQAAPAPVQTIVPAPVQPVQPINSVSSPPPPPQIQTKPQIQTPQNQVDLGLATPDRPDDAVLAWATAKIKSAYSINWVDYKDVMEAANSYFTKQGYAHYMGSLKDSGILSSVVDKRLILQLKQNGPAQLLKQGPYQGQYSWQVEMPVVFMYSSTSEKAVSVKARIAVLISRVSPIDFKDGIAITQLVLKPDK